MLGGANIELASDQRQRDTCHEDDKAFEELAGCGQHPDATLHGRQWKGVKVSSVWPHGPLINIVLDGARLGRSGIRGICHGNFLRSAG
jgi:hypothetical protein